MLLSDKELTSIADQAFVDYMNDKNDNETVATGRAIEAAILAKLAAKELPEPQKYPADCFMREVNVCDALAVSIAIQQAHAQGFAAGAAAQLAEKPTCWVTPDGEGFRMRLSPPVNAVPLGWQELYTRREA